MPAPPTGSGVVAAQSGILLLARVVGATGGAITQASITSIAWTVTDLTLGTVLATGTFTVSSSVFDSLQQNDPRWTYDSAASPGPDGAFGYNFAATLPSTVLAVSTPSPVPPGYPPANLPRRVQVDVAFTPVVGAAFRVIFLLSVLPVYG